VSEIWAETAKAESQRYYYEAKVGDLASSSLLEAMLENIEAAVRNAIEAAPSRQVERSSANVLFAAQIRTKRVERVPESLIAKTWNECLGASTIPFDRAARAALIADGCKHPELNRHIEAWQEMERSNSKWV
jgi:hypothetical protein